MSILFAESFICEAVPYPRLLLFRFHGSLTENRFSELNQK